VRLRRVDRGRHRVDKAIATADDAVDASGITARVPERHPPSCSRISTMLVSISATYPHTVDGGTRPQAPAEEGPSRYSA